MADTSHLDIDYVANLARIALTEDEKELFGRQLEDVIKYVDQLREVDVSGIEPSAHAFEIVNVWQEDECRQGLTNEAALQNAPVTRDNMIVVPKVVDEA